ncbi:Kelch-like protein 4 [Holothuria leucospilota]|uniref:Kelch-like protein 4 n=1 Tax=Holothuria leucospilota TaxID=206669 RepID=A0A9Q0YL45_HOLLE|nr:Kelch-like protein 4 [Holothuria leucospilota]
MNSTVLKGLYDEFNSVERYDPRADAWFCVAPMSICRDSVAVAVLGDQIYAAGGFNGTSYVSTVECYDPVAGEWSLSTPLNGARAGGCLVQLDLR